MALVTGTYVTSAATPLPAGSVPQVEAIPSMPSVSMGGQLVSAKPQAVTPATNGSFTFDLIPTTEVAGDFHYMLRGSFLAPDAYGSGGFTRVDVFEFRLDVPPQGGSVGDLTARQIGNDWVFVLAGDSPDYSEYTGLQLAANGDLFQWQE